MFFIHLIRANVGSMGKLSKEKNITVRNELINLEELINNEIGTFLNEHPYIEILKIELPKDYSIFSGVIIHYTVIKNEQCSA